MPAKTYDLGRVQLTLGGQRIEGFGPDAAIEFERLGPLGEIQTGADGNQTFSRSNNHGMTATITLMETHLGYAKLAALMRIQEAQAPIAPLPFLMLDPISGDRVADAAAIFVEGPVPSKARNAGERVFRIFLPDAGRNALFGPNIVI